MYSKLTVENLKNLRHAIRQYWRTHDEANCERFDGLFDRLRTELKARNAI